MKVEGEQQQEQPGAEATAAAEQPSAVQPSQASDEEVKQKLLVLLGNSDLSTTTEKMLRKQLEKDLGVDLSSKKALIRQEVLDYLEKHQPDDGEEEEEEEAADEEEEEEEEQPKPSKKRSGSGFGGPCVLSEALQAFVGEETMIRTQVVKKIWDYVKEKNLQDPKDRRKIIVDEKLATIFKPPVNMFNMNKQLTNHIFKASDVQGGGGGGRAAAGSDDDDDEDGADDEPAPKRKPAKRQKKAGSHDEGVSKRKGTGFGKPLPLSAELAAACGKTAMNRGEVCKWLYAYCNEHDLKDPKDKRWAICDETLKKLTGEKRIQLFGGQKYFKNHILG